MDVKDSKKTYDALQVKVVEVKVQGILCQSPGGSDQFVTMSMGVNDLGNGGFK